MVWAAWLLTISSTAAWFARLGSEAGFRHNAAFLLVGVVLASRSARSAPAYWGLLLCGVLFALHPFESNLLRGMLAVVGTALLCGVRSAAALLFLCLSLPIDAQLDAFIGVPARLLTARGVSTVLGIPSVEAVLQLENGLADVEVACSGVRGLWIGLLLFFGVSAHLRIKEDARWVLGGCAFVVGLFACNFARVLALVALPPVIAHLVHVPIGLVAFVACGWGVLANVTRAPCGRTPPGAHTFGGAKIGFPFFPAAKRVTVCGARPRGARAPLAQWLTTFVTLATLPISVAAKPTPLITEATLAGFERIALTQQERGLFEKQGAKASKWRFAGGTAIVVVATAFQAHHAPEVCMANLGHRVEMQAPGHYKIGERDGVYWFQSPTRKVSTLIERAFATKKEPWALVSVVFDGAADQDVITQLEEATKVALTHGQ